MRIALRALFAIALVLNGVLPRLAMAYGNAHAHHAHDAPAPMSCCDGGDCQCGCDMHAALDVAVVIETRCAPAPFVDTFVATALAPPPDSLLLRPPIA